MNAPRPFNSGLPDLPLHLKAAFIAPPGDPNVTLTVPAFDEAYEFNQSGGGGCCTFTLSPITVTVSFTTAVGPAGPFFILVVHPDYGGLAAYTARPSALDYQWVLTGEESPPDATY